MGDREQSLELLIEFTKDEDPRTRATALAGLAKAHEPRGFAPVLVALFDPVDEVRMAAATALGIFGDARAFEPLIQGLQDPSPEVAANCVWALGQIPDGRCLDVLLACLSDVKQRLAVRRAAATALGERSALAGSDLATSDERIARARAALLAATRDDDGELRAACVWSFGHLPPEAQTTRVCIELLDDGHEWVVRYAVEALAHFGDEAALEPLEKMARGTNTELASLATQALEILRREGA